LANVLIRSSARLALSIETPASEYEIGLFIIFENEIIDFLGKFNYKRTRINADRFFT